MSFVMKGDRMKRKKLKSMLATVSIIGLVAGGALSMTGCKSGSSCSSCSGAKADTAEASGSADADAGGTEAAE